MPEREAAKAVEDVVIAQIKDSDAKAILANYLLSVSVPKSRALVRHDLDRVFSYCSFECV